MSNDYAKLERVHIENFQAVEDATLELGRMTVLVGAGDVGKSSILRAVRAAFLNDGSDDDIRHGEKQCSVALFFADRMVITWIKNRGKGAWYRMAGATGKPKEFMKTGGTVPTEIAEYLGIGSIEVDATTT
ncbi:hypothetical protein LCGC14_2380910, partial [marine sediment metagenome]